MENRVMSISTKWEFKEMLETQAGRIVQNASASGKIKYYNGLIKITEGNRGGTLKHI